MAVKEYRLPDPGEGLTEAEIVTWHVSVGDTIDVNDVVVDVETAKSVVELPSPYAGTVTALLVEEGQTVDVGAPIIRIDEEADASAPPAGPGPGTAVTDAVPSAPVEDAESEAVDAPAQEAEEEHKTLVGYGPREGGGRRRRRSRAAGRGRSAAGDQVAAPAASAPPATPPAPESVTPAPAEAPQGDRVLAKPPVRKLARDRGIDLGAVVGTGPFGAVTREDLEAAATGPSRTGGAAPEGTGAYGERREPVKGVRKAMAQAMVSSAFTAPHVTEWVTVDVTRTMELLEQLRRRRDFDGVRISPLVLAARAVCAAVRRTPDLNARWEEESQEVVYSSAVHLGVAAATPRGLLVPVLRDAQTLGLRALAGGLNELTDTARAGRTQPAQMAGGTFTVTNIGVFGIDSGTPIITPGQGAILALGAVRRQPWVVDDEHGERIEPRWVSTLALSFDHRFVDGAMGSAFLADVAAVMAEPAMALVL